MDFDFARTRPTGDGLRGVLEICPVWDQLAIRLGVAINQISANKRDNPHAPDAAALASLQQWRDGKNAGYPATWEFLLGKVKEEKGINVANKLRGKIRTEKNWTQDIEESESVDSGQTSSSTPGPVSKVKNDPPDSTGEQRRSDCDPKPEEPKSRLDKKPSKREVLNVIVPKVAAKWDFLGIQLEIEDEAEQIKKDHEQVRERCFYIINAWMDGKGRRPITWEVLVEAVQKEGYEDFADDIQKKLENGEKLE